MSLFHGVTYCYWVIKERIRKGAYNKLWPGYECEQCVGQEYWQGCYCAYYDAWCPAGPSGEPWWVEPGRKLYEKIWGKR